MGPTGTIGCRFSPDEWVATGCTFLDGDVSGHAFTPTHTATISISWREEPNGERQIEFTSDDPDAQSVLMDLLNRTKGENSDRPAAAR